MSDTTSNRSWRDAVSREEIADLIKIEDWRSWLTVLTNWGLIAAAFALVAAWPNVLTVIIALFVIGARQLGMAVIMHEASHRTLFTNKKLNDWAGNWLAAYPVWLDTEPYRLYHLQHHAKTWTKDDPDIGLARPFPITRASLRPKIWRDLSGQTGWKRAKATFKRDMGISSGKVRREDAGFNSLRGVLVTNAILLAVVTLCGRPELYLLWVGAWMTTYSLVMRIRSIAEHAMIPDPGDALRNTRTVIARWWERLVIAPNRVNFHLEHHLVISVPHYKLPRFHRMLKERGVLNEACIEHGYAAVLRRAASADTPSGGAPASTTTLTWG